MKLLVLDSYEEMSRVAGEAVLATVKANPHAVLGLATGSTPIGLYEHLIEEKKKNGTDYTGVTCINLDEYAGLGEDHDQSYAYFMKKHLFLGLGIEKGQTYIENDLAENGEEECLRYDAVLEKYPRDIQILGIGSNGHIAFNEPGTPFDKTTHRVALTEGTIRDNSRFFRSVDEVPKYAYTMGPKSIMGSKKILILASGEGKAKAIQELVEGTEITPDFPAGILRNHPDCTVIVDKGAASLLQERCV